MRPTRTRLAALLVALAACGSSDPAPPSAQAGLCAAPRTGIDPTTGAPYADRRGTLSDEKAWLRAFMGEYYLWYAQIPTNVEPSGFLSMDDYFHALLTPARTASGKLVDEFSFTMKTADWLAFSQSGTDAGYGIQWVLLSKQPPRDAVVAYVEPGSPADGQVRRGDHVLTVDGVDVANGSNVPALNAGMFPTVAGQTHQLVLLRGGLPVPVTLTSAVVTSTPVRLIQPSLTTALGRTVAYVLFNDHIATAERQLIDVVTRLGEAASPVQDLVLDLRYNGGGYLVLASEAAYMLAGPGPTAGKTFEQAVFNDRYGTRDPFYPGSATAVPFLSTAYGLADVPPGTALPHLDLPRVVLITGPGTCSASEAIVNGLRGADVQVVLVGGATCGKPYGFYPQDNCGTTYFPIEFKGVNAKGFGDYADGFVPGGTGATGVTGCAAADDYLHDLGDPAEQRLATALYWIDHGACPTVGQALTAAGGVVVKPPWRQSRILTR